MVLASQTVQVTSEATARPIRTAFTTASAFMNMPQGLRSRGSIALPMTGARPASCAVADSSIPTQVAVAAAQNVSTVRAARAREPRLAPADRFRLIQDHIF